MKILNVNAKPPIREGKKLKTRVQEIVIELENSMSSRERLKLIQELAGIEIRLIETLGERNYEYH